MILSCHSGVGPDLDFRRTFSTLFGVKNFLTLLCVIIDIAFRGQCPQVPWIAPDTIHKSLWKMMNYVIQKINISFPPVLSGRGTKVNYLS